MLKIRCTIVQGHGYHFSVDGEQVLDTPWNNISSQGFQVCSNRLCLVFLLQWHFLILSSVVSSYSSLFPLCLSVSALAPRRRRRDAKGGRNENGDNNNVHSFSSTFDAFYSKQCVGLCFYVFSPPFWESCRFMFSFAFLSCRFIFSFAFLFANHF